MGVQLLGGRSTGKWVICYIKVDGNIGPPVHAMFVGKDNVMDSGMTHIELFSSELTWIERALELGITIEENG